jgi:hypothetical protein
MHGGCGPCRGTRFHHNCHQLGEKKPQLTSLGLPPTPTPTSHNHLPPPHSTRPPPTADLPCAQAGLGPTHQVIKEARGAGFGNVHDYLVHNKTREAAADIAARKEAHSWGAWLKVGLQCFGFLPLVSGRGASVCVGGGGWERVLGAGAALQGRGWQLGLGGRWGGGAVWGLP